MNVNHSIVEFECKAVGSALISAGRSTCANIAKMARLPASDVRLTLLIMMQQNIVTYAGGEEQRTPTFYEINTNEILCRIRFPLYINWATLHLGPIVSHCSARKGICVY